MQMQLSFRQREDNAGGFRRHRVILKDRATGSGVRGVIADRTSKKRGRSTGGRLSGLFLKLAVVPAVEDINYKSQRQPDDEAKPRHQRKAQHQSAAQNDRNEWEPRHKGHAERALALRLIASK